MTLSKRALLVIFPVVLISNLFVAFSVYWVQRRSIEDLEIARVSQQMGRLQSLFESDLDFTRNLVFSMLGSNSIKSFMKEPDRDYRTTGLGVKVQDGIEFLTDKKKRFISFAIIEPNLKVDYYFENSNDPFADIDPAQLNAGRRLIEGPALSSDDYIDENGEAVIIHSELIDRVTFASPLATQKEFAFVVQSAVHSKSFGQLKMALEREYDTHIKIAAISYASPGFFSYTSPLTPTLSLSMTLSDAYIASRLMRLKLILGIGSVGLSLASVGLLLFLVGRNITGPIARLDRQVTEIFEGKRKGIDDATGGGEIGRLSANIKILHDSTVKSLQQVQLMSWTDSLTGISNRSHFNIVGRELIEAARANDRSLRLLFIDLDNFKFVNDTYGHAAGDAVLQAFTRAAAAILNSLDAGDIFRPPMLARLSGDEFAILLTGKHESDTASQVSTAIVDIFKQGLDVEGESYPVSASIGIAGYPEDAASFTQLMSCADKAMYQAKASGKNTFAFHSNNIMTLDLRLKLIEEELRRLDPDNEFTLLYMPITFRDGTVAGCEATLRWESPVLGKMRPAEFIPIAESRGLFMKIDRWVLNRAIGDYKNLENLFGHDFFLSINISSAELYSKSIVKHALDCTKRYNVDSSLIEIELTQTFVAKIDDRTRATVWALHEAGFRIALDDFGSGQTSIKQVLDYPIHTIKLDREFVRAIESEKGFRIIQSIIDLCHAQDRFVVAEGVENQLMHAALSLAGSDFFQGYGICEPSTLQQLEQWHLQRMQAPAPIRTEHQAFSRVANSAAG